MIERIATPKAPAAIGPYAQAVKAGNLLFISGCCPFSPADGSVVGTTIEEQARQALDNLKAIVEAAGVSMDNVVKTTCFLDNIEHFPAFNGVYASYFNEGVYPARSCFEVARLPRNCLVEVEAIVALD